MRQKIFWQRGPFSSTGTDLRRLLPEGESRGTTEIDFRVTWEERGLESTIDYVMCSSALIQCSGRWNSLPRPRAQLELVDAYST